MFLSKYINNLDKKGRVSVPSNYRSFILENKTNVVVAYPSFKKQCIEVCTIHRFYELVRMIELLEPYSEERDVFETILLGESVHLILDTEGRIIINKTLIEHSNFIDKICFIGKGMIFEMWEPGNYSKYLLSVQEIAKKNRLTLKNISTYE